MMRRQEDAVERLDLLARGGRLVAPVGRRFEQYLYIYDKGQDGRIRKRSTLGVMFVPMVPGRK